LLPRILEKKAVVPKHYKLRARSAAIAAASSQWFEQIATINHLFFFSPKKIACEI